MRSGLLCAWCLGVAIAAGGCAPRGKAPGPLKEPFAPVRSDSDGVVDHSEAGDVYLDRTGGFDAAVPPGWTARPRFSADASGPPPKGDLRARFQDPVSGCVIDLSLETLADRGEEALQRAWLRGRELFFHALVEEPHPQLEVGPVWTATLVPADPTRMDIGYWISLEKGETDRYLRVEGRFPLPSFALCKERLDDVVRSVRAHGGGGPSAIAPNP